MYIPFGVFSAGAGASETNSFELISTTLVGSTTSSVTFSSIASTYKHLQLRWVGRDASTSGDSYIRFNGDSGNNYSAHRLAGGTSSVTSSAVIPASTIYVGAMANTNDEANAFSAGIIDILDYANTSKNKTARAFTGVAATNIFVMLRSGAWYNISAISSIEFISGGTGWVSGTRLSLYGVK